LFDWAKEKAARAGAGVLMVDPTLVALAMTGLGATATGAIWLGLSLWKGRCIGWVRGTFATFGHFTIVDRRTDPLDYWLGLLTPLVLVIIGMGWTATLMAGLIDGKQLHSRFRDGTAVFDNEGIACSGDPPGFTHFHSCAGPPLPVPK
jgi:hypothetical protein